MNKFDELRQMICLKCNRWMTLLIAPDKYDISECNKYYGTLVINICPKCGNEFKYNIEQEVIENQMWEKNLLNKY